MKYFYPIAILIIICFSSCDGKHRTLQTHKEKLEKSNLSKSFFKKEVFIPESNITSVTDTILSSGERVKVKYYSLANQSIITKSNNSNKQVITTHYHEFESEIQVYNNNKLLFKDQLSKADFIEANNHNFWNKAILQYVWLDDLESTANNISLNCSFLEPETNGFRAYKVYFNNKGKREIKLIETS